MECALYMIEMVDNLGPWSSLIVPAHLAAIALLQCLSADYQHFRIWQYTVYRDLAVTGVSPIYDKYNTVGLSHMSNIGPYPRT